MSTLEKFGILVILVLVVIIGVVAVWGVGGGEESPFDATVPAGDTAMVPDPALGDPAQPSWPDNGAPAVAGDAGTAPVAPPSIGSGPTPAAGLSPVLAPVSASGGMKYRIKNGDTLAGISKSTLGDANRWKDIVAANPGLDPRRLKIGTEIVIPSGGTSVASAPPAPAVGGPKPPVKSFGPNPADGPSGPEVAVAPGVKPAASGFREVEVRSGDTLYEISRRELGNPNLYYKIMKANPDLDPKRLRAGQKVRIPTDG